MGSQGLNWVSHIQGKLPVFYYFSGSPKRHFLHYKVMAPGSLQKL